MNPKQLYIILLVALVTPFDMFGQKLDYTQGQVIVQFKKSITTPQKANNVAAKFNNKYTINRTLFDDLGIYLIDFDPNQHALGNVLDELNRDRDVLYVQQNSLVTPRITEPDDPFFDQQLYFQNISATEAWDVTTGGADPNGREIVLAVMDRGFDIFHEDLFENVWTNQDEIPNDGIDNDNNGFIDDYYGWNFDSLDDVHGISTGNMIHGTNVAGIAGARGDNDTGMSGVMWDLKVLYMSGLRSEAEIIEAYNYISETRERYNQTNGQEGAYIVVSTISLGITGALAEDHPIWCNLYDQIGEQGVLSVCATDNLDVDVDAEGDMPTTCTSEYMIAVTNTNSANTKASPAAFGSRSIDLGAPGVQNFTTSPNDTYNQVTGTSVSAPLVGGAIALLYSAPCQTFADQALINPGNLALSMKNILYGGVDTNSELEGVVSQAGVLNIFGSMELLGATCEDEDGEEGNRIKILENPLQQSAENITVDYFAISDGDVFIRMFDSKGALVYERPVSRSFFGENRINIPVANNISTGVYYISLSLPDKKILTEKVVIF